MWNRGQKEPYLTVAATTTTMMPSLSLLLNKLCLVGYNNSNEFICQGSGEQPGVGRVAEASE